MDYDELVAKVIELLQREKRVPYRALKRRFELDDEYSEDLKVDLIEAKRLASDENDRILVWIGDAREVTPHLARPTLQPAIQEQHAPQVEHLLTALPPNAERRQLTIMFCDVVDSTRLSRQLDPEDYREVVRAYQQVCAEVIQRYEGHLAQLLGDGLLVYFGYPQAHEDDAQRAVRTGLGIIEAIGALNTSLGHAKDVRLVIRLGIHTGLVVVGEMGGEGRYESLARTRCDRCAVLTSTLPSRATDRYYRPANLRPEKTQRRLSCTLDIAQLFRTPITPFLTLRSTARNCGSPSWLSPWGLTQCGQ
jgi:class 3 adenylate cyclase